MLFQDVKMTLTTSGGAASGNTERIKGLIKKVLIEPTTATNTYTFTLTDPDSRVPLSYETITGTLRDTNSNEPVDGIYTAAIAGATVNEAIKVLIRIDAR